MEDLALARLALSIATKAHDGQFRRDGKTPYIDHPIAVAFAMPTQRLKALAYLHDVIEDTLITLTYLKELGFPQDILNSLNRLTKRPFESYVEYIIVCSCDSDSRVVKIADIKHNLSTLESKNKTMRDKYELTLYVLEKLK